MLSNLRINNYALIESLEIDFREGFSTITGETGAGKSVILGALHLLLGQRADTSLLKDDGKKSVIEAHWGLKEYKLGNFFEEHDVDYEDESIIRREILPSGKSRAFVNDMPVNLQFLKELGEKLIDIHSQHQNMLLNSTEFQLAVVDSSANNEAKRSTYFELYVLYKRLTKQLRDTEKQADKAKETYEYNSFLYNELEQAALKEGEQEELEVDLLQLEHAEEIQGTLSKAYSIFNDEELNVLSQLKLLFNDFNKISAFYAPSSALAERLESAHIELQDIATEIEQEAEKVLVDPEKLQYTQERLSMLFSLQQKHKVKTIAELIEVKNELEEKINLSDSFSATIEKLKDQIQQTEKKLLKAANELSDSRGKIFSSIEKELVGLLQLLGMPNVSFSIVNNKSDEFLPDGVDVISYMFAANKNAKLQNISETASGGELSRVMLCLKLIISRHKALPTIIFDEIDTGVSGDIADKMGEIMVAMSKNMQVISITHLPQIAVKGNIQYLVYKFDTDATTVTDIKELNKEERINEIAKMLSGSTLTDAAIANAKQLLGNK